MLQNPRPSVTNNRPAHPMYGHSPDGEPIEPNPKSPREAGGPEKANGAKHANGKSPGEQPGVKRQSPGERLKELTARAQKGDATVLPELRQALDADPLLCGEIGDLALQAQYSMIIIASGSDLHHRECLIRSVAAMKKELSGPAPTPMEKLLIERILCCWLETNYYAIQPLGNITQAQANQRERERDGAHRRFLSATKALADWRKLMPAAQTRAEARAENPDIIRISKDREADALTNGVPVMN